MASYFELVNDNQKVVIDDQFMTPKFLFKKDIFSSDEVNTTEFKVDAQFFNYRFRNTVVAQAATLRGLGFDYNDSDSRIVLSRLMLFVRCDASTAYSAIATLTKNVDTGLWELGVTAAADTPNVPMTVCMYTTAKMLPSKLGLLVYNEAGDLVFDALKGYLQNVAILNGGVSVGNAVAATYTTTIPSGMSTNDLFISMRSALPYYAAYRISGSGVSHAHTYYFPRMTFPNPTTLQVQLVQQRNVPGNNSSTRFEGYFENVIYCPYGKDFYTGYGN